MLSSFGHRNHVTGRVKVSVKATAGFKDVVSWRFESRWKDAAADYCCCCCSNSYHHFDHCHALYHYHFDDDDDCHYYWCFSNTPRGARPSIALVQLLLVPVPCDAR